jgi:hypothetical protein
MKSRDKPKVRKKGLKNVRFNFLQKEASRREMLRDSATLAGSAFLAQLLPATLLRASSLSYAQEPSSAADLLASMRAKFIAVPMETQKLADNLTMFDGLGGAVVGLNGPDGCAPDSHGEQGLFVDLPECKSIHKKEKQNE